jgi:hypothetical protein
VADRERIGSNCVGLINRASTKFSNLICDICFDDGSGEDDVDGGPGANGLLPAVEETVNEFNQGDLSQARSLHSHNHRNERRN